MDVGSSRNMSVNSNESVRAGMRAAIGIRKISGHTERAESGTARGEAGLSGAGANIVAFVSGGANVTESAGAASCACVGDKEANAIRIARKATRTKRSRRGRGSRSDRIKGFASGQIPGKGQTGGPQFGRGLLGDVRLR